MLRVKKREMKKEKSTDIKPIKEDNGCVVD